MVAPRRARVNAPQFAAREAGMNAVLVEPPSPASSPPPEGGPGASERARLAAWFDGPLGRELREAECERLRRAFATLFGYHLVQVGQLGASCYLEQSRINHRLVLALDGEAALPGTVCCSAGSLPVASDSVDVVVLPHVLEFEEEPHQVLREVERVLIGEGHLVVVGFNPFSLWGLWRLALGWREQPPWSGRFVSLHRLRDWMRLLGFDLVRCERFFYRPPLRRAGLLGRLRVLEQLGRRAWPALGGGYVVIGKKRLVRLIPLKTQWHMRRRLATAGLVEPSARLGAGPGAESQLP